MLYFEIHLSEEDLDMAVIALRDAEAEIAEAAKHVISNEEREALQAKAIRLERVIDMLESGQ